MALVSVVTTTLNRTDYLREAIQSALCQTFTDFELLICDDGALLETKQVCESFNDPRVRHIVNHSPMGPAMNTYSGVKNASSDLIAFLNDDDRWTPDFLSKCAQPLLREPKTVLVFCDHWLIDASGHRLVTESDRNTGVWRRDILQPGHVVEPLKLLANNSVPLAMGSVFRKSVIDWNLYSEEVGGVYDYFLAYCLIRSGRDVFYLPERLTEYRVHAGSASAMRHLSNVAASVHVKKLIMRDPKMSIIFREIRRKTVAEQRHLAKLHLERFHILSAITHMFGYLWLRIS